MDIENATPVNKQADPDGGKTETELENPVDTQTQDGPPPSNKERQEAKEAKAAADQEKASEAAAADDAAKAKEESEEESNKAKEAELDTSVWGDSGDDVANSVLLTLQQSGVEPDAAKALLWDAVEQGDPSKVDRDALVEKVGKHQATLIMAGIENVTSRNNAKLAEVKKTVTEAAGGEENWNKATEWARKAIPQNELEELRDMLDAGGRKADYAARDIIERYNADERNTSIGKRKQVTADSKATTQVEGISRRQYGEELIKLQRQGGKPAQFSALKARRDAGIKQGL